MTRSSRARVVVGVCAVLAVVASACSSSTNAKSSSTTAPKAEHVATTVNGASAADKGPTTRVSSADKRLTIETTSARAAFVSGGDVLVTVSGPAADNAKLTANGTDVTSALTKSDAGRRGLVKGLRDGKNTLEAESGGARATIDVTNHPAQGPVLAQQITPWVCTTEANGLGPATDENCDAPTQTTFSYRATDRSLKPLPDPSARPADLLTVTLNGEQVPFIVRTETGVIDRGVYTIWAIDGGATAGAPFSGNGWNGRLVYRFGGGCGTGYSSGSNLAVGIDLDLLEHGYALATNTLDTFQTACNDVLSAEAMMMTREHFVESFGVPAFTIGDGGSGGAIQQLLIAHNYPGLLDAVSAEVPFPDAVTVAPGVSDCGLLLAYYDTAPAAALTADQKDAISGHASAGTCVTWKVSFLGAIDPTDGCTDELGDQVYNATTNPKGRVCTLQDINVASLGRDPKTGFANRPLDNVGVQYGLKPLNDGALPVDQFLDLNEHIGGYDIDGHVVPDRETVTKDALDIAYRGGRITGPAGPLLDIPIILRNVYTDDLGDIHTRVWPFAIRERLKTAGKDDPNLLLWTQPSTGNLGATLLGAIGNANQSIILLDEWLTGGARPASAKNLCALPDGTTVQGGWELYDAAGPCRDAYPVHSDPRFVAGEALKGDIVKCALTPVDASTYKVTFSAAQAARLKSIFPDGVCDWTKPGIGQQPSSGTWQTFGL